jgi:ubiquitin-protein ligase
MDSQTLLTAKRLKGEIRNLKKNRENYYQVIQDKKDNLLFYFLIKGDSDSPYKDGYYIGKIQLPDDYPSNPGDFYMLTPSGRFTINKKICLTNSSYHKEEWTYNWNIRNMVIGFISVFFGDNTTGISHIKETKKQREEKALNSVKYNMENNKDIFMLFDQFIKEDGNLRTSEEVDEYINILKNKNKKKKSKKL